MNKYTYYIYNPVNNRILPRDAFSPNDKKFYFMEITDQDSYHAEYFASKPKWKKLYNKDVFYSNYQAKSFVKNKFENLYILSVKNNLYNRIKDKIYALNHINFNVSEIDKVADYFESNNPSNELYFLKKSAGVSYGGYDVFPILTGHNFKANLVGFVEKSNSSGNPKYNSNEFTLQKGVRNPDLIDGKKYDFRAYFLLTSFKRITRGYLFKTALIRKSERQYNPDLMDKESQLTNTTLSSKIGGATTGVTELYSIDSNTKCNSELFINHTKDLFEIYKSDFEDCEFPTYNLIGLDYILDSEKNMYLLEANKHPAIYHDERRKTLHHDMEYTMFNHEFFSVTIEFFAGNILPFYLNNWYTLHNVQEM